MQTFSYDQNKAAAADASGGEYITESCVVRGFIESAKWTQSSQGAKALELSFESETGQKANYLSLYYQKKDGSVNEVGDQQIHSLMGCTGVQGLSQRQQGSDLIAPELIRKPVQLALERENYTKSDGKGGFRLQIKCIMSPKSGLTISEQQQGKQSESAEYWAHRFSQNPSGKQAKSPANNSGYGAYGEYEQYSQHNNYPQDDGTDDIPF